MEVADRLVAGYLDGGAEGAGAHRRSPSSGTPCGQASLLGLR
jgi:hypothetical protein